MSEARPRPQNSKGRRYPGDVADLLGRRIRKGSPLRTALFAVITAAGCGVMVWVGFHIAGDFGRAITAMRNLSPGWLVLAAACEFAGLFLAGEALWRLQGRPTVIARPVAQAAALIHLSLGQLMPAAPVEGFTLSFFELRRRGLPQQRAGFALAWNQWLQAKAFVMLAAASTIAVVGFGELPGQYTKWAWLGVGGAAIFLAGTWMLTSRPRPLAAIASALAWALPRRFRADDIGAKIHHFHAEAHALLGRGHQRGLSWLLIALGPLACASSLWLILIASGQQLSVEEALFAGAMAILSSWVPFLPGGVGVAESTVTVVLHLFGVPVPEALAVALVWRAMTLALPAVTGLLALGLLRLRLRVHAEESSEAEEPKAPESVG